MVKAELLVKGDAGEIGPIDAADHRVVLLGFCGGNELLHQGLADALVAVVFVDVEGMFDRVFVGGPGAKGTVAGEAEEFLGGIDRGVDRANYRIVALAFGFEPGGHSFDRAGLVVVEGGGMDDRLIENVEDRSGVVIVVAGNKVDRFCHRADFNSDPPRINCGLGLEVPSGLVVNQKFQATN
jgi:hypothetical protein